MVDVEFREQRLRFEAGEWTGDPLLAHCLDRATRHLLDRERVDCGCGVSNVEQAIVEQAIVETTIVETTMAHVGGKVVSVTPAASSAA